MGVFVAGGGVEGGGQGLGGCGQLEVGQMRSQLLVEAVFGVHESSGWVRRR